MPNHQWWLSNEIEALVKREEQGVCIAGEGGERRCKPIVIDQNNRDKWRKGENWKGLGNETEIDWFCENVECFEN